jgi:hypothetical protein
MATQTIIRCPHCMKNFNVICLDSLNNSQDTKPLKQDRHMDGNVTQVKGDRCMDVIEDKTPDTQSNSIKDSLDKDYPITKKKWNKEEWNKE